MACGRLTPKRTTGPGCSSTVAGSSREAWCGMATWPPSLPRPTVRCAPPGKQAVRGAATASLRHRHPTTASSPPVFRPRDTTIPTPSPSTLSSVPLPMCCNITSVHPSVPLFRDAMMRFPLQTPILICQASSSVSPLNACFSRAPLISASMCLVPWTAWRGRPGPPLSPPPFH